MASLATCKDGSRRIQFFNAAGERRNITLPSCTDERAREIRAKVKTLNADAIAGQASAPETARWLARQDAVLYAKLAAVGLVPPREVAEPKALAEFLDAYINSRGNKPTTITNLKGARRWLVEYFGADRRLDSITPGDADEFRAWLSKQPHRRVSKKNKKKNGEKQLARKHGAANLWPGQAILPRGGPQAADRRKPVWRHAGRQRSSEQEPRVFHHTR